MKEKCSPSGIKNEWINVWLIQEKRKEEEESARIIRRKDSLTWVSNRRSLRWNSMNETYQTKIDVV